MTLVDDIEVVILIIEKNNKLNYIRYVLIIIKHFQLSGSKIYLLILTFQTYAVWLILFY